MKKKSLDYYLCPKCQQERLRIIDLPPEEVPQVDILEMDIYCIKCNELYHIKGGIPRFVSSDNYTGSFGYQWNTHAKTQLDSYTGYSFSSKRLFDVTGWPTDMQGQKILEAGSGAGRFTEILLKTGADLFSFDFSVAVEANLKNNGHNSNLHLFQGDIYHIPLPKFFFDKVICLGVLQHTPDPERAFKNLTKHVRPGGELIIDAYTKRLISLLQWKYLLRPITKRMDKIQLYKLISTLVPLLLPLAIIFRRVAGRYGAKLVPIVEFSYLGLPYHLHKQWSILDTFDWYAPVHDHPQSVATVKRWYQDAGFVDIKVSYGANGVIGKGRCPQ